MYKPTSPGGELLEEFQIPTGGIYFISGHGTDDPAIEMAIPKDCRYCTFAECGLKTSAMDPRLISITDEFMKGNLMFKKPTAVNTFLRNLYIKHKAHINSNSFLKNTKSSITIKNYNKTFKMSKNTATAAANATANATAAAKARHTYTLSTYNLFNYYDGYSITDFCNDISQSDSLDDIEQSFNNIHYEVGSSGIIKFIEEPRKQSTTRVYKMFTSKDFDFFYNLYKDNKSDIYKLVLWTIYNMSVDLSPMIKESFKYSFFPSVGKVLELYETIRHTKKNNILYFNHEFNKRFKINQQDLFEYLPGTYYNFICRTTDDTERAVIRRELSRMNPEGKSRSKSRGKSRTKSRSKNSKSKSTLKSLPRNRESLH